MCTVLGAASLGPHRASYPTETFWILFSGQEMEGPRQRSSGVCHLRHRIRTQASGLLTWNTSTLQASGNKSLQRPPDLRLECSRSSSCLQVSPVSSSLSVVAHRSTIDSPSLSPALCLRLSNSDRLRRSCWRQGRAGVRA